jgi:2-phosphoglycerate kinase
MKKETSKPKKNNDIKHIVISDGKHGLPYSKGVTASSIMATGLSPGRAYRIAQQIEDHLRDNNIQMITMDELKDLTYKTLADNVSVENARKYRQWDNLSKVDKPIIVLVGGTTGAGKSTIASELAYRMGFNRMVSTDAIREIMRSFFSPELMPTLYKSSFNAWKNLRYPDPKSVDPVIEGFREQAEAVMVGIEAIIERAIDEGINMVIEGAHVLPGFISKRYSEKAFILPLIIVVKDEEQHKSHFFMREVETAPSRPYMRYLDNLENIRKIQEYIKSLAKTNHVPVFSSYNLDATVSKALEYIMDSIFGAIGGVK